MQSALVTGSGCQLRSPLLFRAGRRSVLLYGAGAGITHLALEGMETLLPWLPQGHQLDTSLGDKTTGSV